MAAGDGSFRIRTSAVGRQAPDFRVSKFRVSGLTLQLKFRGFEVSRFKVQIPIGNLTFETLRPENPNPKAGAETWCLKLET
jgi:hypothetical protein